MKEQDFNENDRVIYVPLHAKNNINHPDCEAGTVSSKNKKFVFVRFDQQVKRFGWGGATSQACYPSDLKLEREVRR